MALYACLVIIFLFILAISVVDYDDGGLLKKRKLFDKSIHKFIFVVILLVLWFLTAFRDESIGNDSKTYIGYYEEIAKYGINTGYAIEVGYQIYCLLLSKISTNPYFLFIVTATICYGLFGIYIYKYSSNILYSLILLFCVAFSSFTNILRQSIAMVITLFAYEKIKRDKVLIPLLLILFASCFHESALIMLLLFFKKFIPKKPAVVLTISIVLALLSMTGVVNGILIKILPSYSGYFDTERAGSGWLGIFYYCLRAVVFYFIIYKAYSNKVNDNGLTIANSVIFLMMLCFGFSINLFSRVSEYFLLPMVVELPNVFTNGKIKNKKLLMCAVAIVMLAYFLVVLILKPEWNNLVPYKFNWSK